MDAESIYERQLIDANCNDCKFMVRDLETFNKWKEFRRKMQLSDFEKEKAKAIQDAMNVPEEKSRQGQLRKAQNMKFFFNQEGLINYGHCQKLNKKVSFIPNHCLIETQKCFEHRKQPV